MLQRAHGQAAEDTECQEGMLVCHLRNSTKEVAERERYAAVSPGTESIQHFFRHMLTKHSDRATPGLCLSITSPEMHLPGQPS